MPPRFVLRRALTILGLISVICALAYFAYPYKAPSFQEQCVQQCLPKRGIVERVGSSYGPEWRQSHRNVNCVCY